MTSRIPRRWRLLLLAKFLLLVLIAACLVALALAQVRQPEWLAARFLFAALLVFFAAFLVWASTKAARDVIDGVALTESGVVPLSSRRAGYSMRTPSGRFVEFILWNPWGPLKQGTAYTVTYGRASGVIISPPVPEAQRGR